MDDCLVAVRAALRTSETAGERVLIACSGGPDSLALAFLVAEASQPAAPSACVAVVDHGLQPDSQAVAAGAAEQCRSMGYRSVVVLKATVTEHGDGPEAAARRARQSVLLDHAREVGAQHIWLGHTLDDQAETVLIGLTHGSGARALQAMADVSAPWVRPLLHLRRAQVRSVLPASITPWEDPHNRDRRFLRADVRERLLPLLVDVLGDRAVVSLARSAHLLREDNAALDDLAAAFLREETSTVAGREPVEPLEVSLMSCSRTGLAALPTAVRSRVIRLLALHAGATARNITSAHICAVARLALEPDVNGPIALPGGVHAFRDHDRVVVCPVDPRERS